MSNDNIRTIDSRTELNTPIHTTVNVSSPPSRKRKHSEDNKDIRFKVLKKEEIIQNLRIDNLKLQNNNLNCEIENLQLQKTKLQLEVDLLQKKVLKFMSDNQGDANWLSLLVGVNSNLAESTECVEN